MALNSVKFRIEGDGTSAMRALNDVKRGMADLKNIVAGELSSKLKGVFTVAAIEEMTRRTADWATNLSKTAQRLQLTTDELQGFQVAARRINMETSELEGFLGTMESAALDAAKGNIQLLKSFGMLKISLNDLRNTPPAKLFDKVLKGVGTDMGFKGAQDIFGGPGAVELQYLGRATEGKSGSDMAKSSPIVSDEDIKELRGAWADTKKTFWEMFVTVAPIAKFILEIFNGLLQMVKGTAQMVARGWKLITFGLGASFGSETSLDKFMDLADESRGGGKAVGHGVANAAKGMVNFVSRIFGAGDVMKYTKRPSDISEQVWNEGQAAGGAIVAFGTGGIKGPLKPSSVMGAGRRGLTNAFGKTTMITPAEMAAAWKEAGLGAFKSPSNVAEAKAMISQLEGATGKTLGTAQGGKLAGAFETLEGYLRKAETGMNVVGKGGAFLGTTGGIGAKSADEAKKFVSDMPFKGRHPLMDLSGFGGGGQGGNPNLRIGGVFGADVSFKIIQLNQEMVTIMSQILSIMQTGGTSMVDYVRPTGLH